VQLFTLAAIVLSVVCPVVDAQSSGGRGAASNPKSNEDLGVDIDRFIGRASDSPTHLSHGLLLTHSMLRAGDPNHPGNHGAVLEYYKDLSTATLLPKNHTPMVKLPDQFLFYVQSGEGRLEDGERYWDLRENIAVLVPPNASHRFVNDSDQPLNMIMITWTPAAAPRQDILVRDINLLPWCEEAVHWNNASKCVFNAPDGLFQSERMLMVMLQPRAMSQPHSHPPGMNEIWVKVTPGTTTILMGSELREMPQNTAYMVPPTNETEHANLNLTTDHVDWYLYWARSAPTPGGSVPPTANANAGRGARPANPNVVRDRASAEAANIAGKPLK
jgi:mannose-6-phosphate isomerase-like protein (cupin superfamily)